jgi:hypothetical protein
MWMFIRIAGLFVVHQTKRGDNSLFPEVVLVGLAY